MEPNEIVKQVNSVVTQLQVKTKNLKPLMAMISAMVSRSIDLNFEAHGRWDGSGTDIFSGGSYGWKPLAPSTKANYKKSGYELEPTLLRAGKFLKSQIEVYPVGYTGIGISSNTPYSRIHQLGGTINSPGGTPYMVISNNGKKSALFVTLEYAAQHPEHIAGKTKPHRIVIPARPYITLTPDDLKEIINFLAEFIAK
jgi:phage gpG-like protein